MTLCSDSKRIAASCAVVAVTMLLCVGPAVSAAERMTYAQAKVRIPQRNLPEFWFGDVAGLSGRFEKLTQGEARVIAITPGGRTMHLITYGPKEQANQRANFNSAIGAREPKAYRDKAARKRPVVFFVGPVHGHEVEALTGLVNFIHVMETGKDLRGRDQTRLRELGAQCRLLIVPEGNPDGIARFEPRALQGMGQDDLRFWGQGTWSDDTLCGWPRAKRLHPMAGEEAGFPGCYFNDAGINPMHDEFFAPMGPEAPAILEVARAEAPDLAVSFHSHESTPAILRPAFVTTEVQEDLRTLAQEYYTLLDQRDLPHARPFTVRGEGGERPSPFNLTSALYHISGARPFTFECPHGLAKGCQVTLEQILDIQLTLCEAMLQHELDKKR